MELRHLSTRDESEATTAHLELAAEDFDFLLGYEPGMNWTDFLQKTENLRLGDRLRFDQVPATFLIAEEAGQLVGRVSIRHRLNASLRMVGGHIGYAVRRQFRRRGHATRILASALVAARNLGIDNVLLTCDAGNVASKTTIEKAGGILGPMCGTDESQGQGPKLRYWIKT